MPDDVILNKAEIIERCIEQDKADVRSRPGGLGLGLYHTGCRCAQPRARMPGRDRHWHAMGEDQGPRRAKGLPRGIFASIDRGAYFRGTCRLIAENGRFSKYRRTRLSRDRFRHREGNHRARLSRFPRADPTRPAGRLRCPSLTACTMRIYSFPRIQSPKATTYIATVV